MDMFGVFLTTMLEEKHGGVIDRDHASIMTTRIGNMLCMVADAIGKIHATMPRAARDSTGGSDQLDPDLPDNYDEYPAHDARSDAYTKTTSDLEHEAITQQVEDDRYIDQPPAPRNAEDKKNKANVEQRYSYKDSDVEDIDYGELLERDRRTWSGRHAGPGRCSRRTDSSG